MKRTRLGFVLAACLLVLSAVSSASAQSTLQSQTIWGTPDHESTHGVAVDDLGNTYLTGNHIPGFDPSKIFLVKFSLDGSIAWQTTWDGPDTFASNNARDVAVTPDGSAVYVTGTSFISPNVAVLLKFNGADGSLVWDRSWAGNAEPTGVAVDAGGSIHVAGFVRLDNSQIFTTKFDAAGNVIWHKLLNAASGGGIDDHNIAVHAGEIYIAGTVGMPDVSGVELRFGIAVLKLDAAGNLVLQQTFIAGDSVDARGGIAIGPDGSIHVAGGRFDDRTSDLNAHLVKFAASGTLLWNRHWGGRSGDPASGVAVGGDGTVFMAASTNSFGAGSDDAALITFEPDGKVRASVTWGGLEIDHADAIALLANGDVVIGGTAEQSPYTFQKASSHASKDKAVTSTPNFAFVEIASGVVAAGGATSAIAGTTNDDPGFDAAVLIIRP